ncbi:MAG: ClpXP protease specificity-enhancing factor [Pontibacterium sp.]
MKPSRPYLLKALYEWLLDNELTPHLLVNAQLPHVSVPRQFVEDGQIVLNIMPGAVRDFGIEDDAVFFNARFGGQPMDVYVPMGAVMAIYARENGAGMGFGMEPAAELYELPADEPVDAGAPEVTEEKQSSKKDRSKKGPSLRVVK